MMLAESRLFDFQGTSLVNPGFHEKLSHTGNYEKTMRVLIRLLNMDYHSG
jgi:hypothetical protein